MDNTGFQSFMIEKNDSVIINDIEPFITYENEDDYYRQLSTQFYGSKHQEPKLEVKKQPKSVIETGPIKMRLGKNVISQLETGKQIPVVKMIRMDSLKQIHQLLQSKATKPNSNGQLSQKSNQSLQKLHHIKLAYQQIKNNNIKKLPSAKEQVSRTHRLKVDDQFTDNYQQSITSRSILNSSTKSSSKQDKHFDLYYPQYTQHDEPKLLDKNRFFKISYKK